MRLRRQPPPASFERLARESFDFLVEEHGFDAPTGESFPHAEERVTYRRGPVVVDVGLGDSRVGVTVNVTTAGSRAERLGDERFQRRDRSWDDETRRVLTELAAELERRADELFEHEGPAGG